MGHRHGRHARGDSAHLADARATSVCAQSPIPEHIHARCPTLLADGPAFASQTHSETMPDMDKLKELAKMKEDGILTDEEFSAQKAALLSKKSAENVKEGIAVAAVTPVVATAAPVARLALRQRRAGAPQARPWSVCEHITSDIVNYTHNIRAKMAPPILF